MFGGTAATVSCHTPRGNGEAVVVALVPASGNPHKRGAPTQRRGYRNMRVRTRPSRQRRFPFANRLLLRNLFAPMEAELEKLVESGKLTARGADQLDKL